MRGDTVERLCVSPRPSMPCLSIHALRWQEQQHPHKRRHLAGSKVPAQGGTLPCLFGVPQRQKTTPLSPPPDRGCRRAGGGGQQDQRRPLHLASPKPRTDKEEPLREAGSATLAPPFRSPGGRQEWGKAFQHSLRIPPAEGPSCWWACLTQGRAAPRSRLLRPCPERDYGTPAARPPRFPRLWWAAVKGLDSKKGDARQSFCSCVFLFAAANFT